MKAGYIGDPGPMLEELLAAGIDVVARPSSDEAAEGFAARGVHCIQDYAEFFEALDHPRVYFVDAPVGAGIDALIDTAYQTMEPGDVVIDVTASYWCDTLRRYRRMRHRALYYVDVAWLERPTEALLLAGGDPKAIDTARPCLEKLAGQRLRHLGGPAIAHFALMVQGALDHAQQHIQNEAALMMEAWPAAADDNVLKDLWPLVDREPLGGAAWQPGDAIQLEAATPILALGVMQTLAEALDDHESEGPPPRVGPFQHPDEII